MIFRISKWFKRKENIKEIKRAIAAHSAASPTWTESEAHHNRPKRKKETIKKRILASGSLNLFLKPLKPFHYIFVPGTPLFLSNSSFNPFYRTRLRKLTWITRYKKNRI
jgi:hypothetical protein